MLKVQLDMKVEVKLKAATPPSTAKRMRENDGGVVKAGGNERVGDPLLLLAHSSIWHWQRLCSQSPYW